MWNHSMLSAGVLAPSLFVAASTSAGVVTQSYGPTPYLSAADSPFAALPNFTLENFESGALTLAGVSMSAGVGIEPPGINSDSVDGDDGVIDGFGRDGRACITCPGTNGITFTFDANVLGFAPTHVGIVFTDGSPGGTTSFSAFDTNGDLIASIPGNSADGAFSGDSGEDRFYGLSYAAGIGSILMTHTGVHCMEADHLQFAFVPSPGALSIGALGAIVALRRRER